MAGLDTVLRVCIKISGLVLVILSLLKSITMTIGTSGFGGFDTFMFIQQLLIILLGLYLLISGEILVKAGIKHPDEFTSRINFNTIFALGIKIIGLVIMLKYLIAIIDFMRFYLIMMMNPGDTPIVIPGLLPTQIQMTLLLHIIYISFGWYLFYDGKFIRKIASYKLNQ